MVINDSRATFSYKLIPFLRKIKLVRTIFDIAHFFELLRQLKYLPASYEILRKLYLD